MNAEDTKSLSERLKLATAHLCKAIGEVQQQSAVHYGRNEDIADVSMLRDVILLSTLLSHLDACDAIEEDDMWCFKILDEANTVIQSKKTFATTT